MYNNEISYVQGHSLVRRPYLKHKFEPAVSLYLSLMRNTGIKMAEGAESGT